MKATPTLMNKCIYDAKVFGDELGFYDCYEILENHYGKRLDLMKTETIADKIAILYGNVSEVDNVMMAEIKEWLKEHLAPYDVKLKLTGKKDYQYKLYINNKYYSWVRVDNSYFFKITVYDDKLTFFSKEELIKYYENTRIVVDKYDQVLCVA